MTRAMMDKVEAYVGDRTQFVLNLRRQAQTANISFGDLAEHMGVDRSEVSRWFRWAEDDQLDWVREPRLETILKMDRALAEIIGTG